MAMTESETIDRIIEEEKKSDLYSEKYRGFPIWRLFRFHCRIRYLSEHIPNYTNDATRQTIPLQLAKRLQNICTSFVNLISVVVKSKNFDNVIFAFPRLQNIKGCWIDKFTDPVIDNTKLSSNPLIFQYPTKKIYDGVRWKSKRVIKTDFIVFISYLLSLFGYPFYLFSCYRRSINSLYIKAKIFFNLSAKDQKKWHYQFCSFYFQTIIYKYLFEKIKCKRIFVVNRVSFLPQIFAAHQCKIRVYEFQHGITHSSTPLFSGNYDVVADPNIFLVFGKMWIGEQYAIPIDQIINIGWAYPQWIDNMVTMSKDQLENAVLIISSPEITNKIADTVISLSKKYTIWEFHIRCHPNEKMPEETKNMINLLPNVKVIDNTIDSFIALHSYQHIIGENSSVIYEALSMGKNVGRLAYNGFTPMRLKNIVDDVFFYLNTEDDFIDFVQRFEQKTDNDAYSEFMPEIINSLI
jgi:hypothetical protein